MTLTITASAERLAIKTYTVADGLLRDSVQKIKQDSRGFLWFCTAEGISRFDGYGFTNFTAADGLPDRHVNDFLETTSGAIYIATDRGLAKLNPTGLAESTDNPLFTVLIPDNPKAVKILVLYQDNHNRVWVGTSDGLYKLIETDGIAFEPVPLGEPLKAGKAETGPNALNVKTILEDRLGTLWIGTFGSGLFRLSQNGSVRR
ncbi:MAG: two-component regulator propeller domain-containing protein [Pyrinomonadaceae bacterium]